VGSGSNPHPAADVLLEKYIDSTHRYGAGMIADRPTVLADACSMPFRDKSFDYVLAFHVLEHMHDPARFLRELQRVGKAGYIETPNALFERLIPYDVHLLEVMSLDGTLLIHRKSAASPDRFLNDLRLTVRSPEWRDFFYDHPALFHVRHVWHEEIRFEIVNPDVATDWFKNPPLRGDEISEAHRAGTRHLLVNLIRQWYRWRKTPVNLETLLVCPGCYGELTDRGTHWQCRSCTRKYPRHPIPNFNMQALRESDASGSGVDV
jgi:SAM-dependent methyltransferase